jgi:Fe-S-cluster-containing dehydrogenase component
MGFFTDTSVCIGCKACEVACKEWNHVPASIEGFTGNSYDNTVRLGADSRVRLRTQMRQRDHSRTRRTPT